MSTLKTRTEKTFAALVKELKTRGHDVSAPAKYPNTRLFCVDGSDVNVTIHQGLERAGSRLSDKLYMLVGHASYRGPKRKRFNETKKSGFAISAICDEIVRRAQAAAASSTAQLAREKRAEESEALKTRVLRALGLPADSAYGGWLRVDDLGYLRLDVAEPVDYTQAEEVLAALLKANIGD